MTTPAEAVNPSKNLAAMKSQMEGAKMHKTEANTYRINAEIRGIFLPRLSLNGPKTICPAARPNKQKVKLNWTFEALVPNALAIVGKLGRYIDRQRTKCR